MEAAKKRILTRKRNKVHVRKRISGTESRPRVSVFRSTKHIYVQAIDDVNGVVIACTSSLGKDAKGKIAGYTGNKAAAETVGKMFGEVLKTKGVEKIVFDRNGFLYHGRIKSLADGIREAGLQF
ncbi:MAG: 50S ribosomal protein L18 [Deltaproteobacteria bacterium]|jgi:large subunit ribosomal protein L18|nr:50S ribosomal protein L18 [Deltaproteobacteria bacterium]MBT4089440.1 50S ribosomal protein L18 [Deltaproteobacteria bacterium]MBT4266375.1 50S ribosomal protein L18 [Deltaproteobacteria bacterium]MBT4643941.1 50S ribosomal protein L18 [Deltaproteobacteria bacterium]MBT6502107.1 50S ribosomal protein L18 [Deltaproteobacteria bacterium]